MFRPRRPSDPWWSPDAGGDPAALAWREGGVPAMPAAPAAASDASPVGVAQAGTPAVLPLACLRRGQGGRVLSLAGESGLRHRLQALGLRPGQLVQVLRTAPWGGPIHLQVGMTELMLRRRDAARIAIAPAPSRP